MPSLEPLGDFYLRHHTATTEDVNRWLASGNVGQLENLVLQGKDYILDGKTGLATHARARNFLKLLPTYRVR